MQEKLILEMLMSNEEYQQKVLPYLKPEYFRGAEQLVYKTIKEYIEKYKVPPTKEALLIDVNNMDINEFTQKESLELIDSIDIGQHFEMKWLLDTTEAFCQKKALFNALYQCNDIVAGKAKLPETAMRGILDEALGVSFDTNIGHDYIEDAEKRWDYYNDPTTKIPFGLDAFDSITNGGVTTKSLSIFMGGVHFGKTSILCNLAANFLMQGLDVLYFTLEMAEEEISKRIDANKLDCDLNEVGNIPKDEFLRKIGLLGAKTQGKLIVKQFSKATAANFRHVIHEMRRKKQRVPRIAIFDYLNLCDSVSIKLGGAINTFSYYKYVAQELRALMIDEDMAGYTGTQTNRDGFNDVDPDMTNTSESFGVPATVDFQLAIISNQDMADMGQMMCKQIKNRFGSVFKTPRFAIGFDRDKQRLYDLDDPTVNVINRTQGIVTANTNTKSKTFGEFNAQNKDKFNFANFK